MWGVAESVKKFSYRSNTSVLLDAAFELPLATMPPAGGECQVRTVQCRARCTAPSRSAPPSLSPLISKSGKLKLGRRISKAS